MSNPLHKKVTLNLNTRDVIWLERAYGFGWTVKIREWVHERCVEKQFPDSAMTIEDHQNER